MIFGGFMVYDRINKLSWKRFNTIYEKNIYKGRKKRREKSRVREKERPT